jgi:hypothetical protein
VLGKACDAEGFRHAWIQDVVSENSLDPRVPGCKGCGCHTSLARAQNDDLAAETLARVAYGVECVLDEIVKREQALYSGLLP